MSHLWWRSRAQFRTFHTIQFPKPSLAFVLLERYCQIEMRELGNGILGPSISRKWYITGFLSFPFCFDSRYLLKAPIADKIIESVMCHTRVERDLRWYYTEKLGKVISTNGYPDFWSILATNAIIFRAQNNKVNNRGRRGRIARLCKMCKKP